MAEDPQPMTLQQRIAALNAAHIGRIPGEPPLPSSRPKPALPAQRPLAVRQTSINIPHEQVYGTVTQIKIGNQPNGPPPLPCRKQPPPLPTRKDSDDSGRRTSVTSTSSVGTSGTNISRAHTSRTKSEDPGPRIKAPAWGECDLPALPERKVQTPGGTRIPERPKYNGRPSQQSIKTQRSGSNHSVTSRPTLPPPLPTRKASDENSASTPDQPIRKLPPVPSTKAIEQAKQAAFRNPETETIRPPVPTNRPTFTGHIVAEPPPIPHASRPDLSAIQATKPRPPVTQNNTEYAQHPVAISTECLTCRDFSGPDQHASRFPRQQVSSLQNLAQQLTSPFPSPTDKARAIFTWLHYNISYDVDRFFSGNLQGSTPQSTLQSGLAVCEGYAALFSNLATYAGLDSVVVSGHGKGYGHVSLVPGQPLPSFDTNHAWNAVKIDNSEWKLIDSCWGAGHVQGPGQPYIQEFHPVFFAMSNEKFGTKHFPSNKDQFFLPGGARMSWEEYIQINPDSWPHHYPPPTVFSNAPVDYSIGEATVMPRGREITVNQQGIIRFQFGLLCPHWTLERHAKTGPPPVFVLNTHGVDGRNKDFIPLEHVKGNNPGGGGDMWYVDVPARELGAPGQQLIVTAISKFGSKQDARGLTVQEFKQGKGKVYMAFSGVAAWDLV